MSGEGGNSPDTEPKYGSTNKEFEELLARVSPTGKPAPLDEYNSKLTAIKVARQSRTGKGEVIVSKGGATTSDAVTGDDGPPMPNQQKK